jgi:hypothetical protein
VEVRGLFPANSLVGSFARCRESELRGRKSVPAFRKDVQCVFGGVSWCPHYFCLSHKSSMSLVPLADQGRHWDQIVVDPAYARCKRGDAFGNWKKQYKELRTRYSRCAQARMQTRGCVALPYRRADSAQVLHNQDPTQGSRHGQHFQSPLLTAIIRRCFELLSTWVEHRLSHRSAKHRHPYASFVLIGSHTSIAGYLHPHIRQHVFVASLLATYSVSAYVDVEMPENLLEQWPERVICVSLILLWFRNFRGRGTSTASLATYRSYRMLLDQVLVQVENLFADLEVESTGSFHQQP